MIFSILQVSRDRKGLITTNVRHLFSVVYCNSLTAAHVRNHSTAVQPWFVSYKNVG